MRRTKLIKRLVRLLSYVAVGFVFVFVFNGVEKAGFLTASEEVPRETSLQDAIESYYGEWEIVEDYGRHGIHWDRVQMEYEVGTTFSLTKEAFVYKDIINIPNPQIDIEITSSDGMLVRDRMEYPHEMGFDDLHVQYASARISDTQTARISGLQTRAYGFYILTDDEIVMEGDYHHYYRALRK